MADEIKVNRQPYQQPRSMEMPAMESASPAGGSGKSAWVILAIVVLVLVVLGILFRDKLFGGKGAMTSTTSSSGYQAVFLTNGQVYFGKLASSDSDYPTLTDIYYLQVVQPPLQGQQTAGQAAQGQQQPQISLVKLGNELHGPVDLMHIAKNQILFYEDMKSDSQVVKAIQSYKANPGGGAPAPAPAK
jgi:hypothetical protein